MAVELFSLNKSWSRRKRTRTAVRREGEEKEGEREERERRGLEGKEER